MPRARKTLVSIDATPYYHCVTRCVRRAFLCGKDVHSGQSFEHRRQWIEDKIESLSAIFAIDVCSYAVMSNHYHVVLHVNTELVKSWTEREVVTRWHQLFKGNMLSQRYSNNDSLAKAELTVLRKNIKEWRSRLCDISWFMRCINEPIAREANQEDNATGRFWEGRFSSQALLDEKALIACLAYVDLNPVRAKMAKTPEASKHTSIKKRIQHAQQSHSPAKIKQQPHFLMPFVGYSRKDMPVGLPFRLQDYIELVDWTGRMLRQGKRGRISQTIPPILNRLELDTKNWLYLTKNFESPFKTMVGSAINIRKACLQLGKCWTHGIRECEQLFSIE